MFLKRLKYFCWAPVLFGLVLSGCRKAELVPHTEDLVEVPSHFPKLPVPADNPLTPGKILIGEKLFKDVRLSRNNEVSCMSCHLPSHAFSDHIAMSIGVDGRVGERNSTPIFNIAYHPYFFRDGGALTLELQTVAPIENHLEMDMNVVEVVDKLNGMEDYRQLAMEEFGTEVTPLVISQSLSSYMRTLISGNSKYDQYVQGNAILSEVELEGLMLFKNKAGCIHCHSGFDFTDYSFQNIGLYASYNDLGRMKLTADSSDQGKFKVPSLRNLSYTAPYMHDGSMNTLEEVIEHFNEGGKGHWNQSDWLQPLNLTAEEKAALKAFLLTLNDDSFGKDKE